MLDDVSVVLPFEGNRPDKKCLARPENRRNLNNLMTCTRPVKTSNRTRLTLGGVWLGLSHWLNTEAP